MPGLKDTLAVLKRMKFPPPPMQPLAPGQMREVHGFGDNPGALRMLTYRPKRAGPGGPLVVVLHGCTQTAEGYAQGAGWLTLADRCGFVVVAPEQTRANNPNLCFNWFNPEDARRGGGEAESIRAMTAHAVAEHQIDPAKVFVTGLSAGGAMTAAVLAAYPEVFAAGAVVAGLPCGAAGNVQEAFAAMGAGKSRSAPEWGGRVRAASSHAGPWPRVAIWHGDADQTVKFGNAEALTAQWTNVHGLTAKSGRNDTLAGHARRSWLDPDGLAIVEQITIAGMGHGTPLAVGGPDGCGTAGPFLIETGLSSTREIARFFGIDAGAPASASKPLEAEAPSVDPHPHHNFDPGAVITRALRAAGLMK